MIEDAVPPGSIDFVAESSLSLLSEPHLKRLKRNSFKGVLPGIESWFALGDKSKTGALLGMAKVRQVSEHVNLILQLHTLHPNQLRAGTRYATKGPIRLNSPNDFWT